jgi:hypothetical protein
MNNLVTQIIPDSLLTMGRPPPGYEFEDGEYTSFDTSVRRPGVQTTPAGTASTAGVANETEVRRNGGGRGGRDGQNGTTINPVNQVGATATDPIQTSTEVSSQATRLTAS